MYECMCISHWSIGDDAVFSDEKCEDHQEGVGGWQEVSNQLSTDELAHVLILIPSQTR